MVWEVLNKKNLSQPIQSNRLCWHEVYQVSRSRSLPVVWVMRCHNHLLHADSCHGKLWQVRQCMKLQDLLEGDGDHWSGWQQGFSINNTHEYAKHPQDNMKNTHIGFMYANLLTQLVWTQNKKRNKNLNDLLVFYFCTVWAWKTQIRGHCVTVHWFSERAHMFSPCYHCHSDRPLYNTA